MQQCYCTVRIKLSEEVNFHLILQWDYWIHVLTVHFHVFKDIKLDQIVAFQQELFAKKEKLDKTSIINILYLLWKNYLNIDFSEDLTALCICECNVYLITVLFKFKQSHNTASSLKSFVCLLDVTAGCHMQYSILKWDLSTMLCSCIKETPHMFPALFLYNKSHFHAWNPLMLYIKY